jgi:potassium/hydrogen antiporter
MDRNFLQILLGLGALLMASVFASKTTSRLGIPILLIFILTGMISGSEGLGGIFFDDPYATQILGTIALIYILFSGGLSTKTELVAPVWKEGVALSTLGVFTSTCLMAIIIHWVTNWDWIPSALLGATISSTDAAAVFGILKTRKLDLKPKMQALLELESGSNDPMAVFLTLSFIQITQSPSSFSFSEILLNFFIQMSLGGLAGWFMGLALVRIINWLNLEFEGLYPVLTIAGVITIYALSEFFGGNGFLAVYLAGISMGSEKYFSKVTLGVFHDGLAWLMQVAMFLALGLLVYPSQIKMVIGTGIFLSVGLIFFARPLSVFLCLWPFKYKWKEMWFISWGGLRGAVPIILATYFLVGGVPRANEMFNLVFFIVILSMLLQGTTVGFMARWMGVQEKVVPLKKLPFKSRTLHRDFVEYIIPKDSPLIGLPIFRVGLPRDVLVVLIHRSEGDFIPRGNTVIEAFDRLVCLASKNVISELDNVMKQKN